MVFDLDKLSQHCLERKPKSCEWISLANGDDLVQNFVADILKVLVTLKHVDQFQCHFFLLGKCLFRSVWVNDFSQFLYMVVDITLIHR